MKHGPTCHAPYLDVSTGYSELVPMLRCPATSQPLRAVNGHLKNAAGTRTYPVIDGIPILIADERSIFKVSDYLLTLPTSYRADNVVRLRSALARMPSLSRNVRADANLRGFVERLDTHASAQHRPRVLVVGGATRGEGMQHVLDSVSLDVVSTDVVIGPETAIVCDAHDLPFVDESFDAVICQAVLEHVVDPHRVVVEIHRVLRPAGLVYSEIPFIQQVHAGPHDFTRFTLNGHRILFREFSEIAAGAQGGPGMALAWSYKYFLVALAGKSRLVRALIVRLASMSAFWLRYFDSWLARRPAGVDAASGTFFLGEKSERTRSVEEILAAYVGVQARSGFGVKKAATYRDVGRAE